jgi:hypothetical protein
MKPIHGFRRLASLATAILLAFAWTLQAQDPDEQSSGRGGSTRKSDRGDPPAEGDDATLVWQAYPVSDLVSAVPQHRYRGTSLPAMPEHGSRGRSRSFPDFGGDPDPNNDGGLGAWLRYQGIQRGATGGGGMFGDGGMSPPGGGAAAMGSGMAGGTDGGMAGSMGGGMPGGGGGGATDGTSLELQERQLAIGELIAAITIAVEPAGWEQAGGPGSIIQLGGAIYVHQSPSIHRMVAQFLEQVREQNQAGVSLTIDATWLALTSQEAKELTGAGKRRRRAANLVDRKAFAALGAEAERFNGQVTCLNGQTVHIVSGRLHTVPQGGVPVIGSDAVGYQRIIDTPHVGALLEITPTIAPASSSILVDLGSQVARRAAKPAGSTAAAGLAEKDAGLEYEHIQVVVQQLATSLWMTPGEPVLVGGMSFPDDGELEDSAKKQVYLVLEVTVNRPAPAEEPVPAAPAAE